MRPERVLRCISRDADYNAPGRAGQPQRQPDARGVGRAPSRCRAGQQAGRLRWDHGSELEERRYAEPGDTHAVHHEDAG
jgi:hypothetical protein